MNKFISLYFCFQRLVNDFCFILTTLPLKQQLLSKMIQSEVFFPSRTFIRQNVQLIVREGMCPKDTIVVFATTKRTNYMNLIESNGIYIPSHQSSFVRSPANLFDLYFTHNVRGNDGEPVKWAIIHRPYVVVDKNHQLGDRN